MRRLGIVLRNGGARCALVWSVVSASSLVATAGWSQTLTWLGTLGGPLSLAYGVSADGSVVVGFSLSQGQSGNPVRAFRWTQATGMQDLGALGSNWFNQSTAHGVSADGSVVVGWANGSNPQIRAFRWTQATGMQDLGDLGSRFSVAYGVSADGSVVVGATANAAAQERAFRWTQATGMQDLGTLPGSSESEAHGVSADGSVVVGLARNASGLVRAFRWTQATGMQDLGTLGGTESTARSASADGSVVVGWARNAANQSRAFRWTATGGMQDLGTLGGNYSDAAGVSADGSVVVGTSDRRAFRWTAAGGMEDLNQTYASLLTNGSLLTSAFAISPDGRYIVGEGYNAAAGRYNEAFLLDTVPEPASLMALGAGLAGLIRLRRRKR